MTGRRERRRRRAMAKPEGSEFEKANENVEFSVGPHVTHSLGTLIRRDTYSVQRSKSESDVELGKVDDVVKTPESSTNDSIDSRNLTYSLSNDSENFVQCTYNIERSPKSNERRPVPAPRKRKFETAKVSSDTDRDVMEIDLDEPNSTESFLNGHHRTPVPKPRKSVRNLQKSVSHKQSPKFSPEKKKKAEERAETNELPLVENMQDEAKSQETKQKLKRQRKIIENLLEKKGKKKSRTLSSLMKLEKKKIPKISSILKDLKEEESERPEADVEKDKTEFQIPGSYSESIHNGQIYVQGKSGFRAMERDEVLGNGNGNAEKDGNDGMTVDSTVKTAILVQKYWSRAMTYFHGVLAGFGFSHAATVTTIMLQYNYEPQEFISVYSCLSLKIHYAFYTLTALCIVSCFDRIDIGHVNRKHLAAAWQSPSTWIVLIVYAIAFALTLANQMTEARFDAHPGANETEIWNGQDRSKIQVQLLQWYHGVWARDTLVLLAWLLISLSKSDDLLLIHISNMAKCLDTKGEKNVRQKFECL